VDSISYVYTYEIKSIFFNDAVLWGMYFVINVSNFLQWFSFEKLDQIRLNNGSVYIMCFVLQRCINVLIALVASEYFILTTYHGIFKVTWRCRNHVHVTRAATCSFIHAKVERIATLTRYLCTRTCNHFTF
jgi:hypothetical protein